MSEHLRQSIPTSELQDYYAAGWAYVMPDFDKANHSKIEWLSEKMPVYPRFPKTKNQEGAYERAETLR